MGQSIYTTHFSRLADGNLYSTLCSRLSLDGYTFSKSLRKLRRRNDPHFRVVIQPAKMDTAKRRVNQRYGAHFPNRYYPDLEFYLYNQEGLTVFNTQAVEVYHQERLIAFSFFDAGRDSLYSKIAIYDPVYQRHSLGIYTMIKEVEWAMKRGMAYYYPGYVVPGYAEFDYKHRIGPLECLDLRNGTWKPYADFRPEDIPLQAMIQKLESLASAFQRQGILYRLNYNRFLDLPLIQPLAEATYLTYPVYLTFSRPGQDRAGNAVYDFVNYRFEWLAARFYAYQEPNTEGAPPGLLVLVTGHLHQADTVEDFIRLLSEGNN